MAELGVLNSDNKVEQSKLFSSSNENGGIKKEEDVLVKPEPCECVVCVAPSHECFDAHNTKTASSGISLLNFLCKYTQVDLSGTQNGPKFVCKSCTDLINVLEQAEQEYIKLKEIFESILSKNPLFEIAQQTQTIPTCVTSVKIEFAEDTNGISENEYDSENEPLAKKKQQKLGKRKKKVSCNSNKRKPHKNHERADESWKCEECGVGSDTGGAVAEAAHKLAVHTLNNMHVLRDVKTEDSTCNELGSQGSPYSNSYEDYLEMKYDQDDSSMASDSYSKPVKRKKGKIARKTKLKPAQPKKNKTREIHQCDECDAKYSSLARLALHKEKHDGSKPPYICEVCGAHYKHKKACDIHVAMHKGISDWKCEECNKLFPSKNALQRHNNIHTGKLNYQCDLCGKSFIHTSSFKMHKLSHSGVKPHACDVCGLALMTRSHLKRHKRVHSGEKRHECAVCGKRFSERYNLHAHTKSHEPGAAPEPAPPAPRRRTFRCPFCVERFERRYMLERHAAAAHGRTLERPPPTPRNTMSKLLKAQAQRRPDADNQSVTKGSETKDERSPEPRAAASAPHKLLAQLSTSGSWSGAYAAEFLRHDFSH